MEKEQGFSTSPEVLVLNVGGVRFYVNKCDVTKHPDALLADSGALSRYHRSDLNEYFFNRNPRAFRTIGALYRTGKLRLPQDVCGPEFKDELSFWKLNPELMDDSSWVSYQRALERENDDEPVVPGYQSSGAIWKILENVHPSILSKIYPLISSLVLIAMLTVMTLKTIPEFKNYRIVNSTGSVNKIEEDDSFGDEPGGISFFLILLLCLVFFVVESIAYLVFFCMDHRPQNIPLGFRTFLRPILFLDVVTVVGFFLYLFPLPLRFPLPAAELASLRCFRILWFLRFWNPGQGINYIIRNKTASIRFLIVSMFVTATMAAIWTFHLEADSEYTYFKEFADSFYFCIVTMTTVGYGDKRPISMRGRVFGVAVCLLGVVFYALWAALVLTGYLEYFRYGKYLRSPERRGNQGGGGNQAGEEGNAEGSLPLKSNDDSAPSATDTVTLVVDLMTLEVTKSCLGDLDPGRYPRDQRGFYRVDGCPEAVEAVINYYRTGRLHLPQDISDDEINAELEKWNVGENVIADAYNRRPTSSGSGVECDVINDATDSADVSCKSEVWNVLEFNNSRWYTKVYVTVSMAVTILFMTLTPFGPGPQFFAMEIVCLLLFLLEFVLRFAFCPHKGKFMHLPVNITDLLAILGIIIELAVSENSNYVLALIWLSLRACRGFHLCYFLRHCRLARGLWYILKFGLKDFLYIFILYLALTFVFTTWVFFAEVSSDHSHMNSIADGLWWAFVTVTTVGYGDMTPVTNKSRSLGLLCCVSGLILSSLVAAVFLQRFEEYNNKDVRYRKNKRSSCCSCILSKKRGWAKRGIAV